MKQSAQDNAGSRIGPATGYAAAVAGTAAAALLRWMLGRSVGELSPFITFYPVAILSAAIGGTGPGLLATLLGALAASCFFMEARGQLAVASATEAVGVCIFIAFSIGLSLVGDRLWKARRRLEAQNAELQRSQEQLRLQTAALESAANAIIITDGDGAIQWTNRAFTGLTGYAADEVLGQNPRLLKSGKQDAAFYRQMWETILAGRVWHGEVVNKRKDGTRYTEEMTITPLADAHGAITRFIAIKQNVTERKQAETALREARDQLARANAELEHKVEQRTVKLRETMADLEGFSYSITHDMRAPLRAMHAFASLAEVDCNGCPRSQGHDYFQRIKTASRRLDNLILDALDYSKIVREELPLGPVDAAKLLRGMIETYPNLQPPGTEIGVEFDRLLILGNESALTQVFSNLLGNAVKFVAPGVRPSIRVWAQQIRGDEGGGECRASSEAEAVPRSTLSRSTLTRSMQGASDPSTPDTRHSPPVVRIWIEDNGIGIPGEAHEKIFDMFERMHRETEYPGTGIGLALVRKALERMGGRVGLESEPGKGSRFWIELPEARQVGELRIDKSS
jgi:PAS domain S-box-containing protein